MRAHIGQAEAAPIQHVTALRDEQRQPRGIVTHAMGGNESGNLFFQHASPSKPLPPVRRRTGGRGNYFFQ